MAADFVRLAGPRGAFDRFVSGIRYGQPEGAAGSPAGAGGTCSRAGRGAAKGCRTKTARATTEGRAGKGLRAAARGRPGKETPTATCFSEFTRASEERVADATSRTDCSRDGVGDDRFDGRATSRNGIGRTAGGAGRGVCATGRGTFRRRLSAQSETRLSGGVSPAGRGGTRAAADQGQRAGSAVGGRNQAVEWLPASGRGGPVGGRALAIHPGKAGKRSSRVVGAGAATIHSERLNRKLDG